MQDDTLLGEAEAATEAWLKAEVKAPLPPGIAASVERHKTHLADLIASMRQAGLSDDTIRSSVRTVISSYEDELVAAIRSLRG